ncbi:MAG TPA: ferritin family protein [Clostridia bacterium]|nr:ferritin family protein [Clostridia bacterium]
MREFDGRKLFKTVILHEAEVAKLYTDLAEKMEEKKAKALFEKLAGDELRHEKIYQGLLEKLPNGGMLELSDEEAEYTELLIKTHIFQNDDVKARYSKRDALVIAEKVERDSIIFVEQVRSLFPDLIPEEFKTIMKEEKKHLNYVLNSQFDSSLRFLGL